MKVRFARWLPLSFLLLGAFLLIVVLLGAATVLAVSAVVTLPLAVAGGVSLIIGLLYLGPIGYFAVRDLEVVGPVMLGRIPRTSLAPDERLADEEGRLIIVHRAQEPTRLGIYRWMAYGPDWDALLAEDAAYD